MLFSDKTSNKNIVLVALSGDDILFYEKYPEELRKKEKDEEKRHAGWNAALPSRDKTCRRATIYDTDTKMLSEASIYVSRKGKYIRKQGKRYYLNDFK